VQLEYRDPLPKADKDKINDGKAPLPTKATETRNPNFAPNTLQNICDNCKTAVEKWWSHLPHTQLISITDLKLAVLEVKGCKTCTKNNFIIPKILQSMSRFAQVMKAYGESSNSRPESVYVIEPNVPQ